MQDINKGTLDTLSNIPVAGLASGRALCPRSANGAPDCYAATEKLCKDKGYNTGRSLDTESAETCNPRIYLPGYQRKAGDCRIDTFVTRAACQYASAAGAARHDARHGTVAVGALAYRENGPIGRIASARRSGIVRATFMPA
jgi:hypothetical protein